MWIRNRKKSSEVIERVAVDKENGTNTQLTLEQCGC